MTAQPPSRPPSVGLLCLLPITSPGFILIAVLSKSEVPIQLFMAV